MGDITSFSTLFTGADYLFPKLLIASSLSYYAYKIKCSSDATLNDTESYFFGNQNPQNPHDLPLVQNRFTDSSTVDSYISTVSFPNYDTWRRFKLSEDSNCLWRKDD
tara:strand:- start:9644 stop:9964 length:321 start_codon:yes stop_codon:yes gene_type:complete